MDSAGANVRRTATFGLPSQDNSALYLLRNGSEAVDVLSEELPVNEVPRKRAQIQLWLANYSRHIELMQRIEVLEK